MAHNPEIALKQQIKRGNTLARTLSNARAILEAGNGVLKTKEDYDNHIAALKRVLGVGLDRANGERAPRTTYNRETSKYDVFGFHGELVNSHDTASDAMAACKALAMSH